MNLRLQLLLRSTAAMYQVSVMLRDGVYVRGDIEKFITERSGTR